MFDGSLFALKYLPPNEESRSSGRQGAQIFHRKGARRRNGPSGIDPLIRQRVAAGMPEDMWMDLNPILASSPPRASSLAKPDVRMDHHASQRGRLMLRLPHAGLIAVAEGASIRLRRC